MQSQQARQRSLALITQRDREIEQLALELQTKRRLERRKRRWKWLKPVLWVSGLSVLLGPPSLIVYLILSWIF